MAVFRPEQLQNVQPQVPEIGRIFKGEPKRPGRKPGTMIFGQDLDYFRFEPAERTKALPFGNGTLYDHLKARWEAIKEETGGWRSLQIRFPFSRFEDIYHHGKNRKWAEIGGRQTCVRECDGATVTKMLAQVGDKKMVQRGTWACSMQDGDRECPEGCKAEAMLKFMIPALGYPGMIVFTTRSGHDITEIKRNLLPYYGMDYKNIPFRLFRALSPCDHHQADGTVRRQDKWLCFLEIDAEFGMLQMQAGERQYRAQLSGQPIQALPAAPALALPSAAPDLNQEWFNFQSEVQACIQGRSHRPLMQIIEDALNTFPEDWHSKIYAEHDRAASVIGGLGVPVPVAVTEVSESAKANLERLTNIRLLTGYSKGQVKAIATGAGLSINDCGTWSQKQIELFRDALFVDWATSKGVKFADDEHAFMVMEEVKAQRTNGDRPYSVEPPVMVDEEIWQCWQEYVKTATYVEPEAQPVEATLV